MTSSLTPKNKNLDGWEFLDLDEKSYQEQKKKLLGADFADAEWTWVGANSRRKLILQIGPKNELGFFERKSHKISEIENCEFAEKKISDFIIPLKKFLKSQEQNFFTQVSLTLFDNGLDVVFAVKKEPDFAQTQKLVNFAKEQNINVSYRLKNHATPVFLARKNQIFFPDFKIDLTSDIFIQATKVGLEHIIKTIRTSLTSFEKGGGERSSTEDSTSQKSPGASHHPLFQRGLRVADIYAGFGAYTFGIVDLAKKVSAFEGSVEMVELINKNAVQNGFSSKIEAEERDLFSNPLRAKELKDFDFIIINPPRNGASPQISEIAKSAIKKLVYVSCNPDSFRRDAKILIDSGFKITKLHALDQFYRTSHLELIAIIEKS